MKEIYSDVFVTGDGQTINECTSLLAGGVTVQGAIHHCVELIDEHCDDRSRYLDGE